MPELRASSDPLNLRVCSCGAGRTEAGRWATGGHRECGRGAWDGWDSGETACEDWAPEGTEAWGIGCYATTKVHRSKRTLLQDIGEAVPFCRRNFV
jgi:hypothetical protein